MITEKEVVTGKVFVWAVPTPSYLKDKYGDRPFHYELNTSDYSYVKGAVKVHEQEISVLVPAGINLVAKAIETLEDEKVKAREEYLKKIAEYQQQIDGLKLLPAPSKEVEPSVGEYIPADIFNDKIPF